MASGRQSKAWLVRCIAALLVAPPAMAAEPVVIVSLKSYSELVSDTDYLGDVLSQPQIAPLLIKAVGQAGGGHPPKGFDVDRRIVGFITLPENGQPVGGALCLPITNAEDFAASLAKALPDSTTDGDITTFKVPNVLKPITGKAGEKHYFLSFSPESLQELPDPDQLTKVTADISVELLLAKIPDELKKVFLTQVEDNARSTLPAVASEYDRRGQELGHKVSLAGLRRLILDGDHLALELRVDSAVKSVSLDARLTSKMGSTFAESCTALNKASSPFSGLVSSQAAASLLLSVPLNLELREWFNYVLDGGVEGAAKANAAIKNAREAERTKALARFTKLADIMRATANLGRLDQAAVLIPAGDGKFQFVFAMTISRGKEIAMIVEDILQSLETEGSTPAEIQLGVATVAGSRVHSLTPARITDSPIAEGPAHLVITDDALIVAVGGDSLSVIREALNTKPISGMAPIALRGRLSHLLSILPEEQRAPNEISKVAFTDGLDAVSLLISGQATDVNVHLEIQEGILKFAGLLASRKAQ